MLNHQFVLWREGWSGEAERAVLQPQAACTRDIILLTMSVYKGLSILLFLASEGDDVTGTEGALGEVFTVFGGCCFVVVAGFFIVEV